MNKIAAGVVGLAMIAGLGFAFTATQAHALTLAELVELFIALEVIPADKADEARTVLGSEVDTTAPTTPGAPAGSVACTGNFSRNLTIGDTGADVMELQKLLNARGFTVATGGSAGSPGMETQYYGPATAGAVTAMQNAYAGEILAPLGLTTGTGFFGASTRAKANALCSATAPTVPTTPTVPTDEDEDEDTGSPSLSGGEGYLNDEILLDSDIVIDLGDTENVIEVELEAKDSDIMLSRADFMFDLRPWLYFDEVNLLIDGEEVASLSGSGDFTEVGSDYRARFTGIDYIIEEDDKVEIALELVVLNSMAGTRDTDTVNVTLEADGIRAVDGAGLTQNAPATAVGPVAVDFDESFGTGEISIILGDESPEKAVVVLNESSRTSDVAVAYFEVEADDSDMEVTTVEIELGTTAPEGVSNVFYRARLYAGNSLLGTKSVSGATVEFTDVDYTIDDGDEVEFRIEVDFNRADGLTLPATFTVVDIEVTAENEDFEEDIETLTINETHHMLVEGMVADILSISTAKADADGYQWKYTFKFDATAIATTSYISRDALVAFDALWAQIDLDNSGGSSDAVITSVVISSDATFVAADNVYRISKGQTKTVTVEVFVGGATAGNAGTMVVTLDNLNYGSTAADPDYAYTELGAPDFESPAEFINAPTL